MTKDYFFSLSVREKQNGQELSNPHFSTNHERVAFKVQIGPDEMVELMEYLWKLSSKRSREKQLSPEKGL